MKMIEERYWDDAKVGDECVTPSVTVTEAMVNSYADLTGDFTPVHVDEEYARTTPFGTRVAHGLLGLSLADGLKTRADYRFLPGMSLGWTWDFKLPIKLGDTLHAMILPILKRLEAIAQINDTAIQQHMVEKLLADYPAISQAIQHDQSLAAELSPVLQSHLVAGLTAKPTKE